METDDLTRAQKGKLFSAGIQKIVKIIYALDQAGVIGTGAEVDFGLRDPVTETEELYRLSIKKLQVEDVRKDFNQEQSDAFKKGDLEIHSKSEDLEDNE